MTDHLPIHVAAANNVTAAMQVQQQFAVHSIFGRQPFSMEVIDSIDVYLHTKCRDHH